MRHEIRVPRDRRRVAANLKTGGLTLRYDEEMRNPTRPWWKDAVFYQIYPRSFQDSNGDGMGDLPGIISRLDELAALGVNALWLSPVYCSPDADNGYDIANYRDIDPRYGTLKDFDHLVAEARKRKLRIVMDLVVNHTSDAHPWFQASRRREYPYTDYYIWRPIKEDGDLPNNWTSFFQGTVWEWDVIRGEYYLHLFDKRQPDLNWANPAVLAEVEDIMRFWLDRGVAGFRCDVITCLYKTSLEDGAPGSVIRGIEHYKSQPGTHEILATLRRDVLDPYQAFTVGETVMATLQEAQDLTDPARRELDMVFTFDHLKVDRRIDKYLPKPFSAAALLDSLTKWQQGLSWAAPVLENHDQPRIVSHYGDDDRHWATSAKALAVLLLTLRGTPFIYQGQEIGMTNFHFTSLDELDDVESHRMDVRLRGYKLPAPLRWSIIRPASRDNARTPMQWDAGPTAGFTTGRPWLAVNPNSSTINYAAQESDPASVLSFYRAMIELRATSPTLRDGPFEPVYADKSVMVYRRGKADGSGQPLFTVYLNLSGRASQLNQELADEMRRCKDGTTIACVATNTGRRQFNGTLLPWEAVVVRETLSPDWAIPSKKPAPMLASTIMKP